jgi:hypothetical protein
MKQLYDTGCIQIPRLTGERQYGIRYRLSWLEKKQGSCGNPCNPPLNADPTVGNGWNRG